METDSKAVRGLRHKLHALSHWNSCADARLCAVADDAGHYADAVIAERHAGWTHAREMEAEVERLQAERQAVLDAVNLYGDETLHRALDAIGWPQPAAAQ